MTEFIGSTTIQNVKLQYFISGSSGQYCVGVTKTTSETACGTVPGGYEEAVACGRMLLRGKVFPSTLGDILADWGGTEIQEKNA